MEYKIQIRARDGTMRTASSENDIKPGETAYFEPILNADEYLAKPGANESKDDIGLLLRFASFFGMSVAEFISAAAKVLGIPPCTACQRRNEVLHRIKELGMMKSMFLLMKSLKAQFSEETALEIDEELRQVEEMKMRRVNGG
jgi:hypothetical protein